MTLGSEIYGNLFIGAVVLWSLPAQAQVVPDGTIPTAVSQTGNAFTITNGARAGNNLFHSFSQFSVPTGGSAFFNNAIDVQNIISRVTGGNLSTIDGLIQSNGTANLFLMNPSGISFGPNARLQLGGSFFATTANSIKFADGTEFSATNPQASPLLTVSVPVGLQLGQNPAPIRVNGTGHTLTIAQLNGFVFRNSAPTGLITVNPGQTLALVGGDIELQGGSLSAFSGRVELGAVKNSGVVNLTPGVQGWQLSYPANQQFGEIRLSNKAVIDASSLLASAGSIQLQAQDLSLQDGSIILSQNTGDQAGGAIQVNTTQSIDLIGTAPDRQFETQIRSESFGKGAAGNIDIRTQRMRVTNGAIVTALNFLDAPSGQLSIVATESFDTAGTSAINPVFRSGIIGVTLGTRPSANLQLTTGRLNVSGGAQVLSTAAFGPGNGGNIAIAATEINVVGFDPATEVRSGINTASYTQGNAGNLVINTGRLSLLGGGNVNATAYAAGNAGSVSVTASESVTLSGGYVRQSGKFQPSSINSSVLDLDRNLRLLLGFFILPSGSAGNVTVNTPSLSLDSRSEVAVGAVGIGNGGALRINADRIQLNNSSSLNATTQSGEGGNITVNARDFLLLRNGSAITTTAGGTGDGGNITLNTPFIVAVSSENSDIIANAVRGRGGNIQITSNSIFGITPRPQLTPQSDITASSQFGIDGTTNLTILSLTPTTGVETLPTALIDPNQQIAQGCSQIGDSRFVVTGRGGLPENPTERSNSRLIWADTREFSPGSPGTITPQASQPQDMPEMVEATGWRRSAAGEIELYAADPERFIAQRSTAVCAARLKSPLTEK